MIVIKKNQLHLHKYIAYQILTSGCSFISKVFPEGKRLVFDCDPTRVLLVDFKVRKLTRYFLRLYVGIFIS